MNGVRMKNLLTILLIILPLSAYAWGVVVSSGGVAAAPAGCSGGTDGIVGNNASPVGDSDEGNATNPILFWDDYVPSEDGSITYGHYYTHYNEQNVSRMVLMDTSGNVLDYSDEQAANANGDRTIHHVAMTNDYCLVADTHYLIGIWIAADNYSGVCVTGAWGTGSFLSKSGAGMTWSTESFDLSSPTGGSANFPMYGIFNNSANTP